MYNPTSIEARAFAYTPELYFGMTDQRVMEDIKAKMDGLKPTLKSDSYISPQAKAQTYHLFNLLIELAHRDPNFKYVRLRSEAVNLTNRIMNRNIKALNKGLGELIEGYTPLQLIDEMPIMDSI